MVKEGLPFIIVPLLIALVFAFFYLWIGVVAFVLLAVFMAYFFRDPRRTIPTSEDIIVSAADGRVTRVEETDEGKLVSVFLSPLNVHINRSPISGKIVRALYTQGKKVPATRNDASYINERNSLVIEGEKMTVICTQIAGIMARRIVCWRQGGRSIWKSAKSSV